MTKSNKKHNSILDKIMDIDKNRILQTTQN